MSGVEVTSAQMYALLLEVRDKVVALSADVRTLNARIEDHEHRLRTLEQVDDDAHRVNRLEGDMKRIYGDLEQIKRRVWAIPGAATVIAAAALIVTLIRAF